MTVNAMALRGRALSNREVEVLTAVSLGYTDGQIAARLHVTVGTVRTHLRAITAKLGSSNRAHMVRIGFLDGYLRMPTKILDGVSR